MFMYLEDGIY